MVSFGSIIPLIGGMTLGNERAFGCKPSWIVSYPGFAANEEPLQEYYTGVPFYEIQEGDGLANLPRVDVVSTVCPCAGLSMLNCAKGSDRSRGCNAVQNGWMFTTAHAVLDSIKPIVFFGENAPGLCTNAGYEVREQLFDIAMEYGYSLSFIKTDTYLHGIPQHRTRTFYFFWNSMTAPYLHYYNIVPRTLSEYLRFIPKESKHQDVLVEPRLENHISYLFIKEIEGNNWRKSLLDNDRHVWAYIVNKGLFSEFKQFCLQNPDAWQSDKMWRRAEEIESKLNDGLGYWNDSIIFYGEEINAVITKNVITAFHPIEDRSFNYRELLWLMGMPHDFNLTNPRKQMGKIFQNVPVKTAACWSNEVKLFIEGKLFLSDTPYLMQDNIKQRITARDL